MWFKRSEFDRYARFKSHGSAHEYFEFTEMCDVRLPIPSIEEQLKFVNKYNSVRDRINTLDRIICKLDELSRNLYKK